eukprot:TRINITY_DN3347_c0_g1_i1.p1 TRINITY_DN3347_c0_g1~~TRINITY_DN3347_c0_g1_i1.p1  ORF type:complete len:846 (-),score=181.48 TRINITY_DN3347_c0_g1_i1:62-2599(-)
MKGRFLLLGIIALSTHSDGTINLWNLKDNKCFISFSGHKSAVTALAFNKSGDLLASGSKDTELILWDITGETGICKLRGHKDAITDCKFLERSGRIITSSKDKYVKIWDITTQHCVQSLVGHHAEVWSLDINPEETRLITGSVDNKLRVWDLSNDSSLILAEDSTLSDAGVLDGETIEDKEARLYGYLSRHQSADRVVEIRFDSGGKLLGCLAANKTLEIYNCRSSDQIERKLARRAKRRSAKGKGEKARDPSIEFTSLQIIKGKHKIKHFSFSVDGSQIAVLTIQNELVVYGLVNQIYEKTTSIDHAGHRSEIRAVVLSNDDTLLASASKESIKIWNVITQTCIRTIPSGFGLSIMFVPGNRQVIIGTKEGEIEMYDVATGDQIISEGQSYHKKEVWALAIQPDLLGFVSGSSDKTVKLWTFNLIQDKGVKSVRLSQSWILQMEQEVLALKISTNMRFLAAALIDNTIKIFFLDSLTFFLSLYGHSLPVMSLDISTDSTLLVSASADKTVKLWGLDFGDLHKSLLAHSESVMTVRFIPHTHYFITVSKDKSIKYWDGDKFQRIMTLEGHKSEIWSLVISSTGTFFITGANDRSLRLWKLTQEQLFLQEEKENEMDALFESSLEADSRQRGLPTAVKGLEGVYQEKESDVAAKTTLETIKEGERILAAIDLCRVEVVTWRAYHKALEEHERRLNEEERLESSGATLMVKEDPVLPPKPDPNPQLMGVSPSNYLLRTIRRVSFNHLQQALMVLPFSSVLILLEFLQKWSRQGKALELCSRIMNFLLRIHFNQLSSNPTQIRRVLLSLQKTNRKQLRRYKDIVGFNQAALSFIKRDIELNDASKVWL